MTVSQALSACVRITLRSDRRYIRFDSRLNEQQSKPSRPPVRQLACPPWQSHCQPRPWPRSSPQPWIAPPVVVLGNQFHEARFSRSSIPCSRDRAQRGHLHRFYLPHVLAVITDGAVG